jgi:hypothetical protein
VGSWRGRSAPGGGGEWQARTLVLSMANAPPGLFLEWGETGARPMVVLPAFAVLTSKTIKSAIGPRCTTARWPSVHHNHTERPVVSRGPLLYTPRGWVWEWQILFGRRWATCRLPTLLFKYFYCTFRSLCTFE